MIPQMRRREAEDQGREKENETRRTIISPAGSLLLFVQALFREEAENEAAVRRIIPSAAEAHSFRMPLDVPDGQVIMLRRFDDAVFGPRFQVLLMQGGLINQLGLVSISAFCWAYRMTLRMFSVKV